MVGSSTSTYFVYTVRSVYHIIFTSFIILQFVEGNWDLHYIQRKILFHVVVYVFNLAISHSTGLSLCDILSFDVPLEL